MILLCDTNIFLDVNFSSHSILMRFFKETKRFFLGLDTSGTVLHEYNQFSAKSRHLQQIIKRIQEDSSGRTVDLKVIIPDEDEEKLRNLIRADSKFIFQEEINLLRAALANSSRGTVLVCTDSLCRKDTLPIPRQLIKPDMIDYLKEHFPDLRVRTCDQIVKELRLIPEGIPRDWNTLETWLDSGQVQRREHDWLEFKAPKEGLTSRMCRDIAKAVCAMLNTTTGYVIVGVDEFDNARINGFKKEYQGTLRRVDELETILANGYLRQIAPPPTILLHLWCFDVPGTPQIVMIIFVEKGERSEYKYDYEKNNWKLFRRLGTQSVA